MSSASSQNIQVLLRLRPLTESEIDLREDNLMEPGEDGSTVRLNPPAMQDATGDASMYAPGSARRKTAAVTPSRSRSRLAGAGTPGTPKGRRITFGARSQAATPRSARSRAAGTPAPMRTPSRMRPRNFTFDRVFGHQATQLDVFSQVRPLVESVLAGYNATVLAYGSTGSGKTHTIMGCGGVDPALPSDDPRALQAAAACSGAGADGPAAAALPGAGSGVLHRTLQTVFARAAERPDMRYSVELSYVELYNNAFRDLLADPAAVAAASAAATGAAVDLGQASRGPKIVVRESRSQGVYLEGSTSLRQRVASAEEALRLIKRGNRNRATGCTNLNEHSSRSHAIIALDVVGERTEGGLEAGGSSSAQQAASGRKGKGPRRHGRLFVVDLAGSERLPMSGALEDDRLMGEAQAINLSLTVLADVLSALATKSKDAWVVPYRNSKLTHLLRDSLGGSARTVMLVHARCTPAHYRQTLTSLMYAERARAIRNQVTSHLEGVADAGEAAKRARELEELRCAVDSKTMELQAARAAQESATAENARLLARLEALTQEASAKETELLAAIDAARAGIASSPVPKAGSRLALGAATAVGAARKSPAPAPLAEVASAAVAPAASSSDAAVSPMKQPVVSAEVGILTSPSLAGPSARDVDEAREAAVSEARSSADAALREEQARSQERIDQLLLEIREASVNAEKAAAAGEARGRAAAEAMQADRMAALEAELEATKEQAEPELLGRLQRALADAKIARQRHAEAVEQMDEAMRTHDIEQRRAREAQEELHGKIERLHEAHREEEKRVARQTAIDRYYAARGRTDSAIAGARWMKERSARLLRAAEQRMLASEHSAAKHALRLVSAQLRAVRRMAIAALDQASRERVEREQINTEAKEAVAELERFAKEREETARREEKEKAGLAVALAEARARHAGEVKGMERAFGGIKQVYRAAGSDGGVQMDREDDAADSGAGRARNGRRPPAAAAKGGRKATKGKKGAAGKAKSGPAALARAALETDDGPEHGKLSLPKAIDSRGRRGSASSDASWRPDASAASASSEVAPSADVEAEAETARRAEQAEREAELNYRAELVRQERRAAKGKGKGKAKDKPAGSGSAGSRSSDASTASTRTKAAARKGARAAVEKVIDEIPTPEDSQPADSDGEEEEEENAGLGPGLTLGGGRQKRGQAKVSRRKKAKQAGAVKAAPKVGRGRSKQPAKAGAVKSKKEEEGDADAAPLFSAEELKGLASGNLATSSSAAAMTEAQAESPGAARGTKRKRVAGSDASSYGSENTAPVGTAAGSGAEGGSKEPEDAHDAGKPSKRRRLRRAGGGILTDATAPNAGAGSGGAHPSNVPPGRQDVRMRVKAMAGPIVGFGKGGFKVPRLKPRK